MTSARAIFLAVCVLALTAARARAEAPGGALSSQCTPANEQDSGPHQTDREDDGDWPVDELEKEFESMYTTSKRLTRRVYHDAAAGAFVSGYDRAPTLIPARFLDNARRHVEAALRAGYAQWVMWEDMGHGHVFTPRATWARIESLAPERRLETLLADEDTMVLYHAAEHLKLTSAGRLSDDPVLRRRFFERNVIGDNREGAVRTAQNWDGATVNTVREIPGYIEVPDALLYIRAHRDGCFSYRDGRRVLRFDIRL